MPFVQRLKVVGAIFGVMLAFGAVAGAFMPKESNLTPAQKLAIVDDCNQNPDALRCQ